jgi:transcriptional regulator with GAF, ATPase, and Fis domain
MGSPLRPELHEKLTAILAICQKMNSERDLGSLLDLIAREATSLLDCDRAGIFLLDRERNERWSGAAPPKSLKKAVEELERRMIVDALERTRNNQQQASRLLGLSRQGLINKIKRYAITRAGQ